MKMDGKTKRFKPILQKLLQVSAAAALLAGGRVSAFPAAAAVQAPVVPIAHEAMTFQMRAGGYVRTPVASGTTVYGEGKAKIDASNISQGYVMIQYSGSQNRIKVQISKGATVYTYDLNARDAYEVFPFTEGNGTYSVKVFENVTGNQYAQVFSKDIAVTLADQFAPFLTPNQYVNFSAGSAAVQTGAQVAASAADALGVITNVYDYVTQNVRYDTNKAQTVQSGYLPNVDAVLASKTGICFDYAALMTAMLRSQNIPTKLVIGYTGSTYHAWVNVYIDSVGWVDNIIYFDGQNWSLMDPTFASSGGQSEEIKKYIGNASNYQAKYTY
ncbi:MAG: transglutaminase-like domain-containing protein [Lachnospiraceae bacterium]|nr:transglutaminase-like domain-containing protein [Lachnospiraceae bacterium]